MTATQIPLIGTAVVIGYSAAERADAVFGNRLEHINIARAHTHTHLRRVTTHPHALAWHRLPRSIGQHSEHNDSSELTDSSELNDSFEHNDSSEHKDSSEHDESSRADCVCLDLPPALRTVGVSLGGRHSSGPAPPSL